MGWSVTVTDPNSYEQFPGDIHEQWAREHEAYPHDADVALRMAKELGLHSVSLGGGRTPVPYGDDEIVAITITGTVNSKDFLNTVQKAILAGPSDDTPVARHYAALARLRAHPCRHDFGQSEDGSFFCNMCGVNLEGGRFWFDD